MNITLSGLNPTTHKPSTLAARERATYACPGTVCQIVPYKRVDNWRLDHMRTQCSDPLALDGEFDLGFCV